MYYIPGIIGNEVYYAIVDRCAVRFVPAERIEIDVFSRVDHPGLREGWADEFPLSETERNSFETALCAYTHAQEYKKDNKNA